MGNWKTFKALFKRHPRPWYPGICTKVSEFKAGILDANGCLVLEMKDSEMAALFCYAINELTEDARKRVEKE